MKPVSRLLILAALASAPLTSLAETYPQQPDPFGGYWQNAAPKVAELTREERAKFRYQWQHLPPAEQEAMMRQLRQQWREVAPEDRQRYREELMKHNREREERKDGRKRSTWEDEGYGQGYESRQWERPESGPGPFDRPDSSARPFDRPDTGSGSRGRR